MIYLVTGAPGNGKTLYTLTWLSEEAEKEGRQVYYSGIPDLKLPWIEIDDPADWHKVPPGSLVVIDEAQRAFRPRAPGSKVPEHVEKLETHRHHGIDLVLITQHPRLVDSNARRLVGCHRHIVRPFGMARATIHEWGEVRETCEQPAGRADSIAKPFAYPKTTMALYKSAEVHTHKRRIPARVWLLLALPLLIGGVVYAGYSTWLGSAVSGADVVEKHAPATVSPAELERVQSPKAAPVITTAEYIEQRTPRLAGLAYTAPVFDELTKPDAVPFPDACIAIGNRCKCYTQQGTPLAMDDGLCRQVVKEGLFKPFGNRASEPKHARTGDQEQFALVRTMNREAR